MKIFIKKLFRRNTENNLKKFEGYLPSKEQVRLISTSLKENIDFIKKLFSEDRWLKYSEFKLSDNGELAGILYVEGLADVGVVNHNIVNRFSNHDPAINKAKGLQNKNQLQLIKESFFPTVELKETGRMEQVIAALLDGNTCLFVDGEDKALVLSTRMIEKRSIDTSETEASIYGNKEAFTEDIKTNCMMVRRRLPTPDLQFKSFHLGRLSHTNTVLMWIEGIANPKYIQEVCERIRRIDVDNIFGVSMISEMTEDAPLSIWPKYKMTEKPDAVVAGFTFPQTLIYWPTRLINYFLIAMSGILGLYGVLLGFTVIMWHLVSLRPFGIPYFYPMAPMDVNSFKDTLIRAPQWKQTKRPELISRKNVYRKGTGSGKPKPPDGKDESGK